jgi:hypothetical protein
MNYKNIIVVMALLIGVTFSSCVKERSCTCKVYVDNVEKNSSVKIIKDTKKNAEEECTKDSQGSGPSRVECSLN